MPTTSFLRIFIVLAMWLSTTGFLPTPRAQAAPAMLAATLQKVYPTNGLTGVPAISLKLEWGAVQGYTGPVTYRYCLVVGNKNKCPGGRWVRMGTALSATVSNLTPNTTYKWWVRAYNSQNVVVAEADNGPWTFTTMNVPANYVKTGPANGILSQPTNGVTLTWASSTGATSYQYCIDTANNNLCDTTWVTAPSGTILSGLKNNTIYYWQVRAVNSGGSTQANTGTWWNFTTVILPGVFGKLSPAADAVDQPINGTVLSWNISSDANGYEYCVTTISGICSGTWQPTTATSAIVSLPTYGTDYYWQVRAQTPAGSTPADGDVWWKFTAQPPFPAAFNKLTPVSSAENLYTDVTFNWEPSTGASNYEFCLSTTNNDVTCGGMPWEVVTGTSYTVLGIDLATTYYWQVRAVNITGATQANSAAWWSFTTQPNPPQRFTKAAPIDRITKVDTNITLTWSPTATAGVTYQICYDTTDDDACELNNWKDAPAGTSFAPPDLSSGTTYYWQVRATNAGGTTYADDDMSAWWNFITLLDAPSPFDLLSPENMAVSQPLDVTLRWEASDPGVTYEVCIDQTSDDACDGDAWIPRGSNTFYDPTGLSYDTDYFWRVRAKNSDGLITEASYGWWVFSTYRFSPTNFRKIKPVNNSTIHAPMWPGEVSFAGDGFGYSVCLSKTLPLSCDTWLPVYDYDFFLTDLEYNTHYYWQARATDPNGNHFIADNGQVWEFTTLPAPPVSDDFTLSNVPEDQSVSDKLQGADQYTFTLYGSTPPGTLNLLPTGHFTYMPPADFYGQVTFQFTVSDGVNNPAGPYTASIHYLPVNDQPVLNPITVPATIIHGQTLSFTASGADVDLAPGQHLTFVIDSLPDGASFNPGTGAFSWTPAWIRNGVNTYTFIISVSDGTPNSQPSHQEITITVLPLKFFIPLVGR